MSTATTTAMKFETRIDIPQTTRDRMIDLLNQQLADTTDLFTQIKQAHWNVKGMNFMQLHTLFDGLAADFLRYADMIAERASALGGLAHGTARMAVSSSRLDDLPLEMIDGRELVAGLADRFAHYAASTRKAIEESAKGNDDSTSDLFTEISREVDKSLWFIEAHIQA